jgi:hypothetical protein
VSGGYHCAHVLHARAKLDGTVRANPHLFNTSGRSIFSSTACARSSAKRLA